MAKTNQVVASKKRAIGRAATKGKTVAPVVVAKDDAKKKKRRFKPGVQATREIYRQQKDTADILARAPFQRLVREVGQNFSNELRFSKKSFTALQAASEAYLIDVFQRAQYATVQVPNTDAAVSLTLRPNSLKLAKLWVDEVRHGGCDPRSVLVADRTAVISMPNKRKAKAPTKKVVKEKDVAEKAEEPAKEQAAEEATGAETEPSEN